MEIYLFLLCNPFFSFRTMCNTFLFITYSIEKPFGGTQMSDLTASNCGCDNDNRCGCNNNVFGGNSNSWIWIILLLSCCGGCGNGFFGGNNNCGCGCGCGTDTISNFGGNSCIWIIILLFFCGGGNNNGCC